MVTDQSPKRCRGAPDQIGLSRDIRPTAQMETDCGKTFASAAKGCRMHPSSLPGLIQELRYPQPWDEKDLTDSSRCIFCSLPVRLKHSRTEGNTLADHQGCFPLDKLEELQRSVFSARGCSRTSTPGPHRESHCKYRNRWQLAGN